MKEPKVLAFVMAGGEGSRLHPLTHRHSKPSLPFGGRYRIVDFVLSNLINSGINSVYLLVQYKSQSLIEHIRKSWVMSPLLAQQFVTVVPPQMLRGENWFQGTADAVHQNINLIEQHDPDLVIVFGADHIYRMDLRQMISFHREREADVSVAALPVPLHEASSFGVIAADSDSRVREFQEKPKQPASIPNDPAHAYASMGNYVFNTSVLLNALEGAFQRGEHDFGQHILPRLMNTHRLYAYDFSSNKVPGVRDYEEAAYWRDVGTIDAYFQAHQDLLGLQPRLNLFNGQWPIYSSNYNGPVVKILGGNIENSMLGAGTFAHGAVVRNSTIRREVALEEGVELDECIIQDYVRIKKGARLRRVIVGRYNVIEEGTQIGYDAKADSLRYHASPSGIVVIPPGEVRRDMSLFGEIT
ncbi:MAG: glucose-1-phosphate adenylyltransferase [Gammaproteobacteria bacterium]|nr:glucose-1-phosphate adenylyltransferase [Gammaproteobacteria bacterium]MCP5424804.1 glucose-1-phosphate adenylyltransferase [Gammaproteobacteria bacterium]MCP5458219.1 glucose-1-phosphate adenylyltransferase [Gammaproteobacteria bacterium]